MMNTKIEWRYNQSMNKWIVLLFICLFSTACQKEHVVDEEKVIDTYQSVIKEYYEVYFYHNDKGMEYIEANYHQINRSLNSVLKKYYHPDVIYRIEQREKLDTIIHGCGPFKPFSCGLESDVKFEVIASKDKQVCMLVTEDKEFSVFELYIHYEYIKGDYKYTHAVWGHGFEKGSFVYDIFDPRKPSEEQRKDYPVGGCAFDE